MGKFDIFRCDYKLGSRIGFSVEAVAQMSVIVTTRLRVWQWRAFLFCSEHAVSIHADLPSRTTASRSSAFSTATATASAANRKRWLEYLPTTCESAESRVCRRFPHFSGEFDALLQFATDVCTRRVRND